MVISNRITKKKMREMGYQSSQISRRSAFSALYKVPLTEVRVNPQIGCIVHNEQTFKVKETYKYYEFY